MNLLLLKQLAGEDYEKKEVEATAPTEASEAAEVATAAEAADKAEMAAEEAAWWAAKARAAAEAAAEAAATKPLPCAQVSLSFFALKQHGGGTPKTLSVSDEQMPTMNVGQKSCDVPPTPPMCSLTEQWGCEE